MRKPNNTCGYCLISCTYEVEILLAPKDPSKPIQVRVSLGDLIDKITILQIKSERISDPDDLAKLSTELKAISGRLWQVEDDIRGCENAAAFGPRFIQLARSVYQGNDVRGKVKRGLPVASPGTNQPRIRRNQFLESLQHSQTCRGMNIDDGTAHNCVKGDLVIGPVQQTEAARPPATLGIEVCAGIEQDVYHLGTAGVNDCRRVERTYGLINLSLQLGMAFEELADASGVIG
jgi:hypothetical protein